MGRRRAKATKVVKKKQPTMQTEFKCPFCNYEKCVAAKMDYDKETGTLECRVCAATYTATINYLSEPVDVFSEWIDQCEAEDEERAKRDAARDTGEDVEEDAPAPKRTRIASRPRGGRGRGGSQRRPGAALHAGFNGDLGISSIVFLINASSLIPAPAAAGFAAGSPASAPPRPPPPDCAAREPRRRPRGPFQPSAMMARLAVLWCSSWSCSRRGMGFCPRCRARPLPSDRRRAARPASIRLSSPAERAGLAGVVNGTPRQRRSFGLCASSTLASCRGAAHPARISSPVNCMVSLW